MNLLVPTALFFDKRPLEKPPAIQALFTQSMFQSMCINALWVTLPLWEFLEEFLAWLNSGLYLL